MLLIQFILITNLILLLADFILLIQYMPAEKAVDGQRPKRPGTEARRAVDRGSKGRGLRLEGPKTEDRGRPGPVGHGIIGERAASPLATSYSLESAVSSTSGSRAEPQQPNCFPAPKATLNCLKKCHHAWSSRLVVFQARFVATAHYHWRCRMVATINGQFGGDCWQPIPHIVYHLPAIAASLFYWIRMKVVQQLTCVT